MLYAYHVHALCPWGTEENTSSLELELQGVVGQQADAVQEQVISGYCEQAGMGGGRQEVGSGQFCGEKSGHHWGKVRQIEEAS